MKKKVLQIGPYSAVGGVSIHIKRLSELLKGRYNFQFIDESPVKKNDSNIYNIRSKNLIEYYKLLKSSDVVHIHTGIWWLRCIHIINAFVLRKDITVTIHSLSNLKNKFSISITKLCLLIVDKVVVVNQEIKSIFNLKNSSVIHAFLPPIIDEEEVLPKDVLKIIEKNKGNKIIISNAFKLVKHNGQDLYGLDLLIDVAKKIKKEQKRYRIIFVIASMSEKDKLYNQYVREIEEQELEGIIYLIPYSISFARLMLESDLVVRATNTDGDALTVREALYLTKPIIASDIATRPTGTILFENRNSEDLFVKINKKFKSKAIGIEGLKKDNNYRDIYSSIYN